MVYSMFFMNQDTERTKTISMVAIDIPAAIILNHIVVYGFVLYTIIKYLTGQINLTIRVIILVTLNYALMQIVTSYLGSNIWGSLSLICYVVTATQYLPRKKLSPSRKAVVITGCDRGIGYNLAQHLDAQGFHVFAGFLDNNSDTQEKLVQNCSHRLRTVQMDVSDVEQVGKAAGYIATEISTQELEFWGVVNNAGICFLGNVEIMPSEDMYKVMAINFFGPVNVCKTFLPLLRQNRGRLVNVASNTGLAPVPLMGVYCASKAALAIMSEVWRYELRRWGIEVATIIPSGYKTGIVAYDKAATADRWWSMATNTVQKDYGRDCFNIEFKQKNSEKMLSANFSEILDNITDALLSASPRAFYYSGFLARTLPFLYLHLPTMISDPIMHVLTDWYRFQPNS